MASSLVHRHREPARLDVTFLIGGVVVLAWAVALIAALMGQNHLVDHHALLHHGVVPGLGTLVLFLVAWQVMTGAMMLPSSLPVIGSFVQASRRQAHPYRALAVFLTAYFLVWSGFAVVALAVDAGLHHLVLSWSWLAAHAWLIPGGVLVLAGAFQYSPLKERCLDACRSPLTFLWRWYGRGAGAAWRLGLRHAAFCLGCCWALMLTMFAVGINSLVWMAVLTGVMLIEKTSPWGRRLAPVVGGLLLAWGVLVLLHPPWLPAVLSGS